MGTDEKDISKHTKDLYAFFSQDLHNPETRKHLLQEIQNHLNKVQKKQKEILAERQQDCLTSTEAYGLFRYQERNENNKHILQYLISFIDKIPNVVEISEEPINPFMQFKAFVMYNINLLREKDVIQCILKDYEAQGLIEEHGVEHYIKVIQKNYNSLKKLADSANAPVLEHFHRLFFALNGLCMFWFSVRGENLQRIRKCDIYIFMLSKILPEML